MVYPYHIIILCLERKTPLCNDLIRNIIEYVKYEHLDDGTIRQAVRDYKDGLEEKNKIICTYEILECDQREMYERSVFKHEIL